MQIARERTRAQRAPLAAARRGALAALALALAALVPRVLGLADFVTTDEVYNWLPRIGRFSAAIAERRWGDTVLTGHPGITLLWLGQLGLSIQRAAVAAGWPAPASALDQLAWLRLPAAALEALAVPAGYLLLRRLLAPASALIAGLLWATSPYLIAHARFYHLDALLTTFVTMSVLCALLACREPARARRWIVAAGACAGLALLTKGPALILLPTVGLLLLGLAPARPLGARLLGVARLYALWLASAAATFALLWPAMWVDPSHALRSFVTVIVSNGGRPNGAGQFFLGHTVGDPGALFYLVADLFRTTPAMLLGLLGLPFALIWATDYRRPTADHQPPTDDPGKRAWQQLGDQLGHERRALLALLAFVALWTLVMTLGPKKFDRYTLPTWPALLALAGAGWKFWLWDLPARWRAPATAGMLARSIVLALLLASEAAALGQYHPYYLSYYSPLLGGGAAAQRALLIGWGEGMDQVGAYLSARPDIQYGPVLSVLPRTLQPFVPVPVKDMLDFGDGQANYAVIYLESVQLGEHPAAYARIRQTLPLHRVTIGGIDYAEIYQLPRPFDQPVGAQFGEALLLRGVSVARAPGQLIVTPAWDVRARPAADYVVFVHLLDSAGQTLARVDIPPGGGAGQPTSAWQPGQQIAVPLPLALPDMPPGDYRVTLGLYDAQTGQRLPFAGGTAADPALDGPHALLIDTLAIP